MQIKHPEYFGQLLHKKGFKIWFLYVFQLIEKRKFIQEALHADLFKTFQEIYDQQSIRDNINLPPRSAKTTLAKYFIAYCLADSPKCNFIYTSYSQDLLRDISRELTDLLQHPFYKAMYPHNQAQEKEFEVDPIDEFWRGYLERTEKKDKFTSTKIITAQGGIILFASIGRAITGFGAGIRGAKKFSGCLIIDDGNKPADIRSQVMRQKVKTYYQETLLSRLNDSLVAIINIQQRLHLDDLSGFLISEYEFRTLKCPLIKDGVCQLPSQYLPERIKELQKNEYAFAGQYQQEPVMEGGNLFKSDTFIELPREEMPSNYDYSFMTVDLSYKGKEKNDYTVFSYWGVTTKNSKTNLFLRDCKRKQINAVDVEPWILPWIEPKVKVYGFRYIWIEDKSHGIYLNQAWRKRGLRIPNEDTIKKELPRDSDKRTRANNIIPCLSSSEPNLFLCSDIQNFSDLVEELLAFTGDNSDKHDDFVDTLIDAVKITFLKSKTSILDVI